jgi:hypothetical protein
LSLDENGRKRLVERGKQAKDTLIWKIEGKQPNYYLGHLPKRKKLAKL